ncbi:MAG: hypothetical protein HFG09_07230 [Oscillibacter sp.]|nr:hypothetical protein [Oscillibacter sp.]
MPANTEERRRKYRRQAVLGIALFGLLQLACTACFGALCFIPGLPRWAWTLFAALAVFCAALMIPALMVLKQRFREIEGGELDAAAEY